MHAERTLIIFLVLTTVLFLVLISVILSILSLHRKKQDSHKKELQLIKSIYEKELLKTQLEIQEQTFNHIALELHDNVGHFLALAKLHLSTINCIQLEELEDVREKVNESILLLTSSLEEIRNLSKSLNTESIKENGLIKTVEQLIKQVEKSGKFQVQLSITGVTSFLDDQKEIVLFRIIQEAFNNILKHSKASKIIVRLNYNRPRLNIMVKDDGIGFNVENTLKSNTFKNCSGLKNIITRSTLINASYEIESASGKGTTINISTSY